MLNNDGLPNKKLSNHREGALLCWGLASIAMDARNIANDIKSTIHYLPLNFPLHLFHENHVKYSISYSIHIVFDLYET
jgi:hypothetical protein